MYIILVKVNRIATLCTLLHQTLEPKSIEELISMQKTLKIQEKLISKKSYV
jgi:hypothetical protein